MPNRPKRSARQTAIVIGLALFVSYAYFYQAGGWNQNSRFALVRAILERHTLQIDAYQLSTGDKALWQGHYYTDKAPGISLLSLAPVAVARGIARVVHVDPEDYPGIAWTSYVATVVSSGLFTLVAALLVMRLSLQWGFSRGAALFAATAYGIASPAWCYATLFMEHAAVAGSLMLAYAAAVGLADGYQRRLVWAVGLWTGFAVICELQAAVPAAVIVLFALDAVRRRSPRDASRAAVSILAAGMILGVVLLAYNTLAFGSPFHIGYTSEEGFKELHKGFFGITYPTWHALYGILFSSFRGLLPLAPLVAIMPAGWFALAKTPARRRPMIVAAAIAAFYLLLNASYFFWEGGWAYGPRQLMPALPFLALGLAPLWDSWGRIGRVVLMAGWIWGAALTLIAVSTTPQPPAPAEMMPAPVSGLLWPAFKDGDLSLNNQTFVTPAAQAELLRGHPELHAGWNLGEIAGLHGLWSLAPLGLVWLVAAVLLL